MDIKRLLRLWFCPFVIVLLTDSSDAWFMSKLVEAVLNKIKPKQSTGQQTLPNCPTSEKVIPRIDALEAAYAAKYVYHDDKQVGYTFGETSFKIVRIINTDDLKAFIADKDVNGEKTRIISFRGTKSLTQLMQQFTEGIKNTHEGNNYFDIAGKRVRVLTFVKRAYDKLIDGIKVYIGDPNIKYIITGHSMGGSVASLFALYAKIEDFSKVWEHKESCLVTFGAPRLGDVEFAKLHDEQICPDRKIRIVYRGDPAPHVPKTFNPNDFVHHSREVWFSTQFMLGKGWYGSAMKVCKNLDPRDCSNRLQLYRYQTRDHANDKYIYSLKNVPSKCYDKNGNNQGTWEKALEISNA